eukprot:359590-Chlamydomonas_euryale.AAC.13
MQSCVVHWSESRGLRGTDSSNTDNSGPFPLDAYLLEWAVPKACTTFPPCGSVERKMHVGVRGSAWPASLSLL